MNSNQMRLSANPANRNSAGGSTCATYSRPRIQRVHRLPSSISPARQQGGADPQAARVAARQDVHRVNDHPQVGEA